MQALLRISIFLIVVSGLSYHAPQFQRQWNDNLAKAYAQNFTSEELKSLASEGRNSRYFGKLSEKQAVVGDSMQRMSSPVLTAYVSAALNSALSRMPAK